MQNYATTIKLFKGEYSSEKEHLDAVNKLINIQPYMDINADTWKINKKLFTSIIKPYYPLAKHVIDQKVELRPFETIIDIRRLWVGCDMDRDDKLIFSEFKMWFVTDDLSKDLEQLHDLNKPATELWLRICGHEYTSGEGRMYLKVSLNNAKIAETVERYIRLNDYKVILPPCNLKDGRKILTKSLALNVLSMLTANPLYLFYILEKQLPEYEECFRNLKWLNRTSLNTLFWDKEYYPSNDQYTNACSKTPGVLVPYNLELMQDIKRKRNPTDDVCLKDRTFISTGNKEKEYSTTPINRSGLAWYGINILDIHSPGRERKRGDKIEDLGLDKADLNFAKVEHGTFCAHRGFIDKGTFAHYELILIKNNNGLYNCLVNYLPYKEEENDIDGKVEYVLTGKEHLKIFTFNSTFDFANEIRNTHVCEPNDILLTLINSLLFNGES